MIRTASLFEGVTARVAIGNITSDAARNGKTTLSGIRYTCRSMTETTSSIDATTR